MTNKTLRITALRPVVLIDKRRVTLEMAVEGLPAGASNIMLMPDISGTPLPRPVRPDPGAASPYPNIELSILNSRRQQIASLMIVEHQEPHLALTLHLPSPDIQEQYIARAEMIYNEKSIDVVEVPFSLNQAN